MRLGDARLLHDLLPMYFTITTNSLDELLPGFVHLQDSTLGVDTLATSRLQNTHLESCAAHVPPNRCDVQWRLMSAPACSHQLGMDLRGQLLFRNQLTDEITLRCGQMLAHCARHPLPHKS